MVDGLRIQYINDMTDIVWRREIKSDSLSPDFVNIFIHCEGDECFFPRKSTNSNSIWDIYIKISTNHKQLSSSPS